MVKCIFCEIYGDKIPSNKISESRNFFIINDINPVSEGHSLIISKNHYETFFDLPSNFGEELIKLIQKQGKRLIDGKKADGIKIVNNNYEASGQVVKHFHVHIIPEKLGIKRRKHV